MTLMEERADAMLVLALNNPDGFTWWEAFDAFVAQGLSEPNTSAPDSHVRGVVEYLRNQLGHDVLVHRGGVYRIARNVDDARSWLFARFRNVHHQLNNLGHYIDATNTRFAPEFATDIARVRSDVRIASGDVERLMRTMTEPGAVP